MSRRRVHAFMAALSFAAMPTAVPPAGAGHEVTYYPSFYPQEIRIEPLDPQTAATEFGNGVNPLHAYIGTAPRFGGAPPAHLKSAVSLHSFITVSVNPQSARMQDRDARCHAVRRAAGALAEAPDVIPHPYPITPYHADYLGHIDLVEGKPPAPPADALPLMVHAGDGAAALLDPNTSFHPTEWDVRVSETAPGELARAPATIWPEAPWAKEGWFQAYRLLRPALADPADREQADLLHDRLTHAEFSGATERIALERGLIGALTRSCESAVIGYRLRRELYNDEFSNGVENIVVDSQSGLNTPAFVRTVKLKDFPWNGWLRLGIDTGASAAWNPVAGFADPTGRLAWAILGDSAFLPMPHSSGFAPNRVERRNGGDTRAKQSVRVPANALMPRSGTGRLEPTGAGQHATAKVTYRVSASAFHDGSEMEAADLLYPYALAFRWSEGDVTGSAFDPDIAHATELMRERLKGVRILRVEETKLALADLTFTYRKPIVEVYLDSLSGDDSALLAPPWSSVPWHLLALMEAAVERGIAAFSRSEAERRRLPWLDLVRDSDQRAKLHALIKEFRQTGYRPAALEELVSIEGAKARWQKLDAFVAANNHLLVTNGPYRLKSAAPDAIVFDVVREFTYPVGLGTFDSFAYPPRAIVTRLERVGNRILVAADVEWAVKQQRDRRILRAPLKRESMRETLPIRAVARYLVVRDDGSVVAAGNAAREPDGRFAVSLPPAPGPYDVFTAVFLDGNTVSPSIGRLRIGSN